MFLAFQFLSSNLIILVKDHYCSKFFFFAREGGGVLVVLLCLYGKPVSISSMLKKVLL